MTGDDVPDLTLQTRARALLPALVFLVLALALRWPLLGDPVGDFDEQFYFLGGAKLLAGKLPYIDLWDRKPFGLFALFAVSALLGGGNPIAYQLLATAFATVGAVQVHAIARQFGGAVPAMVAGAFYLLGFSWLWAPLGQSEVFYLPLLLGMLQLTIAAFASRDRARVLRLALWAMLLGGLSLQVKYTTLPHCAFAGLAFLARLRALGMEWRRLAGRAALFAAIGVAPTALVAAGYAAIGHFAEFWFANFVSIFGRGALLGDLGAAHRLNILVMGTPLGLLALGGVICAGRHRTRMATEGALVPYACAAGFTLASLIAFGMLGNVYSHYFLPVVPGLALLSVPFFAVRRANLVYGLAAMALGTWIMNYPRQLVRGREDKAGLAEAVQLIGSHIGPGHCLFIHDGPSILYHFTGSCLPTRYAYPDHLQNSQEMTSIGVDTGAEVRRILSAHPGAIVTADKPYTIPNPITAELVREAIGRDYVLAGTAHIWRRTLYIWTRRDERRPV